MTAQLVVAAAAVLALATVAGGLRRAPAGHAAVVVGRHHCRPGLRIGSWVWRMPGTRRMTLVNMARQQVVCAPSSYVLPGGRMLRFGLTVGLNVGDPCQLAVTVRPGSADSGGEPSEADDRWIVDWAGSRIGATLPALLKDLAAGPEFDAAEVAWVSLLWPRLRLELAADFEACGLIVQEVWLREVAVEGPQNS